MYSQKTPRISPTSERWGVYCEEFEKIDRILQAWHSFCSDAIWKKFSYQGMNIYSYISGLV